MAVTYKASYFNDVVNPAFVAAQLTKWGRPLLWAVARNKEEAQRRLQEYVDKRGGKLVEVSDTSTKRFLNHDEIVHLLCRAYVTNPHSAGGNDADYETVMVYLQEWPAKMHIENRLAHFKSWLAA